MRVYLCFAFTTVLQRSATVMSRSSRGTSSRENHSDARRAGSLLGKLESRYDPIYSRASETHWQSLEISPDQPRCPSPYFSRSEPVVTSHDNSFSKVSDAGLIGPWRRSTRRPTDRTPYRATVLTGSAAGSWCRCWASEVPSGATTTTSRGERASGF